jgi:RHS repeat-associated protein
LNGVGSKLVEVDATNRIYRLESEQFWEVQLYTGASNGDSEGEYWILRTPDGYTYQFGREESSSYQSLQFVRVWVPSGGNPGAWCGGSTSVYCDKGYQWNLEKVTDPDGYTMEVFYTEEGNEYDSNGTDVSYIRNALLDYIVYGDGPTTEHHAKVDFVYDDRCFETTCVEGDAQDFPDTPVDLDCSTGDCTIDAASFWTSQRLARIDTYARDFAQSGDPYVLLDRYELTQDFPTIPDDPDGDEGLTKLWLIGIQRLAVSEWPGDADAVDLPATTFDFVLLPNRMTYREWEWVNDAPLYMPRISEVTNELGGVTTIEYGRSHDCYYKTDSYDTFVDDWPLGTDTLNDAPTPGSTFRRRQCDEFLAKDPTQTSKWVPMRNWKVIRITVEGDHGNPDVVTTYDYRIDDGEGDPTTWPLWKWQEDPFGGASVWNDYRGHRRVKVIDGSGASRTFTFYGGVNGDHEPTQTAVLSLTDPFTTSDNVSHTDYDHLAGQVAEVAAYDASGTMLTRTLTEYWAAETVSGKGTWVVRPAETTETVFGSPVVTASTEYTYSASHGNPTLVVYHGTAGDDPVAEQTTWIQSSTFSRMWLPSERMLWDGSAAGTAGDEVAMVRYFYDGATSHATQPSDGKLTRTRYYTQRDPSDVYVDYQVSYDTTAGWPTAYTDPEGTVTGFGYDGDYGSVASRTLDQGGSLALASTFEVHPGRGVLVSSTDPNNQSDLYEYDELGRLVEYWNRTRNKASSGTILFSYTNAGGGAPAVTRERPLVGGNRLDSYTYFDGFGRTLQTQTPFDQDGDSTADDRTMTSVGYDNLGRVRYQSAPYVNTYGAAGESWVNPDAQWLSLDGNGDRLSSSYTAAITGDADVSARLRLADHTPTSGYSILGQWGATAATRSLRAGIDPTGRMVLQVAQNLGGQLLVLDGTGDLAEVSSAFDPGYTSDLEWRIRIRPADWTPATAEVLMAMEGQELSPQRTATYDTGGTGSKAAGTSHSIPITSATNGSASRPTLVVVLMQAAGNVSYSWPAGWTEMADYGDGDGSGAAAYKLYTGAVDDITATTSGSTAPNYEWISYTDVASVTYTAANHTGGGNFDPPNHTAAESVDASFDKWLTFDSGRETSGSPTHETPSGYTRRHERVGTTLMGSFFDRAGTGGTSTNPNPSSCCYAADAGVVGTIALHGVDPTYAWSAAFSLNSDGKLAFSGGNGVASFSRTSTAAVPGATDGLTDYWLKVTWDGATGDANFYYDDSPTQGSYTQIGGTVTGAAHDIVTSSVKLRVGDGYGSTEEFTGQVFRAQFRTGIGGSQIANPRFDDATEWNDSGPNTDAQGRSWALAGNAAIDANVIYTTLTSTATVASAVSVTDNATDLSYRWTLDRDNGAGGADARFYWRARETDPWTQLGSTVTLTTTLSPQSASQAWLVGGDLETTGRHVSGRLYAATLTSGIGGTVVASPHPDDPLEWPATAAHGDDQSNTWTPQGNAAVVTTAGQAWLLDSYTRTNYDALGRVTSVDAMSGGVELFDTDTSYGTATNQTTTTTTDPEGRWVTHYSNGFGQLARVAEPGSLDTYYTFTPRGELATVTDDDSNVTTISYDLLGRKTQMVDPDMGTWAYEYYPSSRLQYQTDGRGTTLGFVYDDLGRITQRKQGTTVLAEWFYGTGTPDSNNLVGRLVKSRINGNDTDAVVEYDAYDPDGNLLSQDLIVAGTAYEVDYTYYNGGALEDLVYPLVPGAGSRETVTTTYNGLGQPWDLVGGQTYVDAALWTPQGQPSAWTLGDGSINRSWTYYPDTLRVDQYKAGTSQLSGSSTANLVLLAYQYDDSGNVTRIKDNRNSDQYECYGYDTSNRLVDAFTGNSSCTAYSSAGLAPFDHDYAYDSLHNLTSLDGPTYTYGTGNTSSAGDAGPHAVVSIGSTLSFGYDNNGNRITKTEGSDTTAYTYNPENRLSAVDLPSDSDDVVFVYDADGNRVSRAHGTYTTTYVAGLMEVDRTASTVTETRTTYSFAGTPIAVRTHTTTATTFLFQNHLGSTVAAFNETTNTHIKQYYYPYGAERHNIGTLPVDQRYTGQTSDATGANSGDTDLYYYNARYYDPQTGAFAAADTVIPAISLSAGLNRYTYVSDSPATASDPTGHTQCEERNLCAESQRGVPKPVPPVHPEPPTPEEAVALYMQQGSDIGPLPPLFLEACYVVCFGILFSGGEQDQTAYSFGCCAFVPFGAKVPVKTPAHSGVVSSSFPHELIGRDGLVLKASAELCVGPCASTGDVSVTWQSPRTGVPGQWRDPDINPWPDNAEGGVGGFGFPGAFVGFRLIWTAD